ncbi:MAG: DnaJ domain-containing protein [Candidatus Scalindua sp.]
MTKFTYYILITILIIYIVSPLDLHPLIFDDLIASGFLYYIWQKFKKQKSPSNYYSRSRPQANIKNESDGQMGLNEAHRVLHVNPDAPWEEVQKAYKERMAKSHPDKVSHLSEELQKKAKELTLEINKAFNIIKSYKKG